MLQQVIFSPLSFEYEKREASLLEYLRDVSEYRGSQISQNTPLIPTA